MPNGINYVLRLFAIQSRFLLGLDVLRTSTIKIGDRVEVHTVAGRITHIRARSTTVVTNDNITLIVPNSVFVEHTVTEVRSQKSEEPRTQT
jgi:small-conductance mechanosensitive channel